MLKATVRRIFRTTRVSLLGLLIFILLAASNSAFAQHRPSGSSSSGKSSSSRGGGSSSASFSGARQASPRSSSAGRSSRTRSSSGAHRRTGTVGRSRGSRGYSGGHLYYGGHYYGGYASRLFGYGFYGYPSYLYWGGYYPYSYYPAYRGYVVADAGYASERVRFGAIDLNIKPKKGQVYVDGRYLGQVGSFDGFPNYLWLADGAYELTIYLPGYENLVHQIEILPDQVIRLDGRLQRGVAVLPERPADVPEEAPWVSRPARTLETESPAASEANDLRGEPARLVLGVSPQDASVYLDGRFLGSARELSSLRAPLIIDAGPHLLQVVHPDYTTQKREFEAEAGEELVIELELVAADEA